MDALGDELGEILVNLGEDRQESSNSRYFLAIYFFANDSGAR